MVTFIGLEHFVLNCPGDIKLPEKFLKHFSNKISCSLSSHLN
jgi:hypothetical protein